MTEKEKMLSGKIYDPSDAELLALRVNAHGLCQEYNSLPETSAGLPLYSSMRRIFPFTGPDCGLIIRAG